MTPRRVDYEPEQPTAIGEITRKGGKDFLEKDILILPGTPTSSHYLKITTQNCVVIFITIFFKIGDYFCTRWPSGTKLERF